MMAPNSLAAAPSPAPTTFSQRRPSRPVPQPSRSSSQPGRTACSPSGPPAGRAASANSSRTAARPATVPAAAAGQAAAQEEEDASIRVKLMLAESSGRLDLSECGLACVPRGVFELEGLEELSLAGNQLRELPAEVGRLTSLKRLQLAGNSLTVLPDTLGALTALEGAWLHGNQLAALPDSLGSLGQLTQLSLAGNCLRRLPESLGALTALRELSLAGNLLEGELTPALGQLASLTKLSLHGNSLAALPAAISGLQALEELWLQGNPGLSGLPPELGQLAQLKHLSAADCGLESVPQELGDLPAVQSLSLYGNRLQVVPPAVLQAPLLKHLWLEANPLTPEATQALLQAAPASPSLRSLGLDSSQLAEAAPAALQAATAKLRPCHIHGSGPGYFKLEVAAQGGRVGAGPSAADPQQPQPARRASVLVVSFGSAPGTPNWGGVLGKVRSAAVDAQQADFDVLYVVDPHRAWYRGGDEGYDQYAERLESLTTQYEKVVLIGDSMGATAALLFAHLATSVHAFCPQVDLFSSSIRPGQPEEWFAALRDRVLGSVAASRGAVQVHVGNWRHDLDQARALPHDRVRCKVYSVDSHRLALYLDRRGKLEQVIRGAVLQEMGLESGSLRLVNLV